MMRGCHPPAIDRKKRKILFKSSDLGAGDIADSIPILIGATSDDGIEAGSAGGAVL